jgi:hypothetical protein
MGKVYKDKKGSSCSSCKPHKNGFAPKKKRKVIGKEKQMDADIRDFDDGTWIQGTIKGDWP